MINRYSTNLTSIYKLHDISIHHILQTVKWYISRKNLTYRT